MFTKLRRIGAHPAYWLTLLALCIAAEGVALTYQHILDYGPCVLCIHVRIWVMALILVAIFGALVCKSRALCGLAHLMVTGIAIGLSERSWLLFGIERGTATGSCSMESGLPAWFALDAWFPALFKVWEACGYTPEFPVIGLTMAEALIVLSPALLALGLLMLIATVIRP